jgi:signal transduction histidine kinase/coenzyme F420-reducing hydrogenase delta subunit
MKILHIAQERGAALVAPRVVHGIAQNVTLTWAQTPASALQWLHSNPDTAAVIVEVQAQSCASFVEQLRGLGLTTPVVVVAGSARLEAALAVLNSGADGYVVAGPSLEADLPRTVAAAIERERSRRQLLTQTLTELGAECERAEQQLARVEEARRQTEQRGASDLAAAASRLADVEARHSVSLARETKICMALQQRLFELESALRKADERRASEAVSFADQLAKRHAEFTASLAQAAQSRAALAAEFSVATVALDEARQARRADAAAAAEHLRRREAELRADLAEAVAVSTTLDNALAEADAAHQDTRQRAAIDLAAANERQAALEDLLSQEADRLTSLDRKLTAAEAAHQEADRQHAAELTRAAAGLAELQARYDAALEENAAARAAFERQTAEAASALERASRERTAEAAAAAGQLASMEAELGARLAEAAAARTALERTLTEAQSAQQHAMQRAAEDLASAAARQAALEDRLAQETDRGMGLGRQLSAAETARQDTDRRHASELALAGAHLASLQTRYDTAVTEHAAAHAALEQRLTDAATAHQQAEDRTAAALAAASTREAELVERLTRESDARAALERDLTGTRMESARARIRSLYVISTYRRRAREQKARLEAQLTGERTDADRELRAKDEQIRQIQLEHETLRRLLGTTQDQLQHLYSTVEEERQAHERARLTSESELQRVSAEYGQIRQSFDRLQSAFQTLEQIAGEHAAERVRLEAVVADRDSQLSAQAERHRVAEQDAQDALAELQERLRQALDAGGSEIARLQQEIDALRRELDASRTHAEALRGVAERVPDLQTLLERSQNERRRQFERAPYALCRCSESGAITDANHSFVTLLGCRRVDELRNMDFVAAALDSAGDLGWLLERARTTRKTETVETQWKTWEGRRLVVRLQALATATGSIDIVAEDITGVRALEERLRQAQRMEAVGRLASEVALTCDALLSDVARGAHEWLARVGSDDALRRQAERLLTDVTRAASFLRQLGMYGNEQVRALEPVSAQRVLRDLAPVLKRLVGDQIELVLPKSAGSFNVDVDAERLERVLINVAGYARERMPSGGQVRIDLATTAVGRRFVARYSNVRPGDHVLITVTELPAVGEFRGDSERSSRSSDKPGIDLGVLVGLIASCGGHLWLEAQPAGNMVLKIHLPKPPAANATDNRGGRLSRWFRSTSPANVRA